MNLNDMQKLVRDTLMRGTAVDEYIPTAIRNAIRKIERSRDWAYMFQFGEIEIENSRSVEFDSYNVKKIPFIRYSADGVYTYLSKIDPKEMTYAPVEGMPSVFWLSGTTRLYFNNIVTTGTLFEIGMYSFSAWNADPQSTNWLYDNASDLLHAQALLECGMHLRDERMISAFSGMREEALRTLTISEEERDYAAADTALQTLPRY